MRIKTESKRREILDAAVAEFSQRGFHETTLSHVAERLGSSKATIYNYFRSKNELLGSVLVAVATPATAMLIQTFDKASPLVDKLSGFARAYVRMQCNERAIALQRLLIAENDKTRSITRPLFDDPEIHAWPHLARMFRDAQRERALGPGDCDEMARHLSALLHGNLPVRLLFWERDSFTVEEQDASADSAVRLFLAAYGPR